jgi:hypothetical protein
MQIDHPESIPHKGSPQKGTPQTERLQLRQTAKHTVIKDLEILLYICNYGRWALVIYEKTYVNINWRPAPIVICM